MQNLLEEEREQKRVGRTGHSFSFLKSARTTHTTLHKYRCFSSSLSVEGLVRAGIAFLISRQVPVHTRRCHADNLKSRETVIIQPGIVIVDILERGTLYAIQSIILDMIDTLVGLDPRFSRVTFRSVTPRLVSASGNR